MPQYELNLRDYWQIVQKRQGILLLIFFSVLTSTIVYTNLQKPVYRAVASVQWQVARPVGQKLIEMMIFVKPGNPLVSQGRIIKSQPVEERIVGKPDESTITVSPIFTPQVPVVEAKDIEQIYNNGLLLAENLLSRAEKKGPLEIKMIVPAISSLIEKLKLKDATLLSLVYKKNTPDYLHNHLIGVCIFSLCIGLELELAEDTLINLGLSAILHDLGMVNLRQIIQQPRRLNPQEYESVKTHPELTVEYLEKFKDINPTVKSTILSHHERINGQGYPKGLKKEEIPLEGKVLAVADVWEALTHQRPWRNRFIPHEAMLMMRDFSDSLLDSQVVKVLVDKLSIYPIGSLVELNSAEIGEVIFAERGFPTKLKIIIDAEDKRLVEPRLIEISSYPNLYIEHPVEEKEIENT